jgi:hypothetical protein
VVQTVVWPRTGFRGLVALVVESHAVAIPKEYAVRRETKHFPLNVSRILAWAGRKDRGAS